MNFYLQFGRGTQGPFLTEYAKQWFVSPWDGLRYYR